MLFQAVHIGLIDKDLCLLSDSTWNGLLLEASLRRLFGSVHTLSAIN